MCLQRSRNVLFSSVHTYTGKQRFQKVPLWRVFSKNSLFIDRFHRIRVDGSRIRKENVAFSNENGYVLTGPKTKYNEQIIRIKRKQKKKTKSRKKQVLFTSGKVAKKKCFQSGLIIRKRTLSVVLIKSLFIHFFQLPHLLFNKTMSDFQY